MHTSALSSLLISFLLHRCLASILRSNWLIGSNFGVAGTNASFDYVVVGGGTAGLTLATRLAQNGSFSVAVIEAGGFYEFENGNVSQIPAFAPLASAAQDTLQDINPLIDWRFLTTPQPGAAGRQFHYVRGKCLGGSSARNYMSYTRATVGAMQKWADQVGDDSYTWERVLPYYQKGVHFTPPDNSTGGIPGNVSISYDPSDFSPTGGPLEVGYAHFIYGLSSRTSRAWTVLGVAVNPLGFSSGRLLGWQFGQQTINPSDQTRSSSQTSYLTLAMQETALLVYTHSFVQRILFDSNNTAIGVLVEADGVPFYINATKEVVLSAGAFQSPQLLMVSGIGPAPVLRNYSIDVIADRPGVGQNMWDNINFGPSYEINLESTAIETNPEYSAAIAEEYLVNKGGPLTSAGVDLITFGQVSSEPWANISNSTRNALAATFPPDWPEVEWVTASTYGGVGNGPPDAKNYGTVDVGLLACLSRGNVTIASASMKDAPIINPNWLTHSVDQEIAIAAFKRVRELFHSPSLAPIVIGEEVYPGANVTSDADILSAIQSSFVSFLHAAGTCQMGMRNDTMSVVDSNARVIGVQRLRVVDISAFPFLPPGQPQANVYMLAEKIADDILSGA